VVGAPAATGGVPTNQYTGSQGVAQFVAAFQAAADSPAVLLRVAEETKQDVREVDANLSAVPVGTSPIMRVTYRTRNADVADDVAQAGASETLRYLFGSQVELAKRQLDSAQVELDAINKELGTVFKDAGSIDPPQLYADKLQEISTLRVRQSEFAALGQPTAAASIASTISSRAKDLAELAPKVQEYRKLTRQADTTHALIVTLRQNFSAAQAQADAADPERVITLTKTHAEDRLPVLLQKIGPAIGAGLFLALELVVILELLARRRKLEPIERAPEDIQTGVLVPTRA
jgi:uncharacterized protein involved in exopolysaccharide biosynthesis